MSFSSLVFLFYFLPAVLLLYYLFRFSKTLKNIILFFFSLLFYAWGDPGFVFVIVLSIIANYFFALYIDSYRNNNSIKKFLLVTMCISNISVLFIFKYLDFFIFIINELFHTSYNESGFGLPIGISFFTFQAMSYVIDVYRKKVAVQKNIFYVGLYISFFGKLMSGPIVRYSTIQDQLVNRKENMKLFSVGCCRFITGLSKKVLIANNMAVIVDRIFDMSSAGTVPISLAWIGSIAYTLQIYYDFSGYSDMAIGIGLMFGFKFDENFNFPYISKSITEFWRRWHISLGQWFRDYVYFPLGGSRLENMDKVIRNLLIVWILTGLWHGAEWTFLFWGMLNFICITVEKILSIHKMTSYKVLRNIYTLFVVNIGWVIFRSDNLEHAGHYIASMFGFIKNSFYSPYSIMFLKENAIFFVVGIVFSVPISKRVNKFLVDKVTFSSSLNFAYPIYLFAMFLVCITYLIKGSYNPFIYFNF